MIIKKTCLAIFKTCFMLMFILFGNWFFMGCNTVHPVAESERYTFQEETIGLPPWQAKWERKHQPEDPDWRWNMPWEQDTFSKGNIEHTKDGLRIWARNGKQGCLFSNFSFKYGIVTAKIRLPNEEGAWSAFWLFGEDGLPEYDIIEHCGGEDYVNVTQHWGYAYEPFLKKQTTKNKRRGIVPTEWNIYQVEVTPYKIIYRINGRTVRSMKKGLSSDEKHIIFTSLWGEYCGGKNPDAYMEVQWLTLEKYK